MRRFPFCNDSINSLAHSTGCLLECRLSVLPNLRLFTVAASNYDVIGKESDHRFQDCYAAAIRRGRKLPDFRPQCRSWSIQPFLAAVRLKQAFGFRPAAIHSWAQRTPLVHRSMLIRLSAPSHFVLLLYVSLFLRRIPNTMLRKLLRLLFATKERHEAHDAPKQPSLSEKRLPMPTSNPLEGYDLNSTAGWSPVLPSEPPDRNPVDDRKPRQARDAIQSATHERCPSQRRNVARRHAEDIIFLGRGVSHGLDDRHSDETQLSSQRLPMLSTPADIAEAMKLTVSKLRWLAFHRNVVTRSHYYSFRIPRRNGKPRTLLAPHRTLAYAQGWILDEILCRLPTHNAAHGFVPERSVVTNARPHLRAHTVINMDPA